MAFDQSTRNRLQKFVNDARNLLTEEFTRQLQATYGLDPKAGSVADVDSLTHLDNRQRQTANVLRDTLAHYLATTHGKGEKDRTKQALSRIVREQAFTVLNRLAALRMAEARGFLLETIAKGYNAKGFQLYKQLAGSSLGETGEAYRNYLYSVFDEFSLDLAVLFDRHSAQGRLFPRDSALLELLDLINHHEIEPLWAEDETIGWIYQFWNARDEIDQMRSASRAPRNSREMAVRNQFFTPRYVIEFLTDNTLGRIWYEMTQGNTGLVESCRYLVRRPTEVFLKLGELAPEQEEMPGHTETLSQEELLKQPIYITHRAIKDPRCIRMLDPACGSMHFGLYAFDLYEHIYEEAWQLESELGAEAFVREGDLKPLHQSYDSFESYRTEIPRLIIEHNIHGVDIDSRAVQIAGLSLWQRAQRAWKQQGVNPQQRPMVKKSNIVCAEPMPGERTLLEEFSNTLNPPVLGQLLEAIFEKMELAGEAGTLLKMEEEIQSSIHKARDQWHARAGLNSVRDMFQAELDQATPQKELGFDLSGVDDESFWDGAELLILEALSEYASKAESNIDQKRLFAEDASRGFAFIDLCRKRYDALMMNPPFGEASTASKKYIDETYTRTKGDVLSNFIERAIEITGSSGLVGAITSRTCLFLSTMSGLREEVLGVEAEIELCADLGDGVLDAMVETAAYTISKSFIQPQFYRLTLESDKQSELEDLCNGTLKKGTGFIVDAANFRKLNGSPYCYWIDVSIIDKLALASIEPAACLVKVGLQTGDDFRFLRNFWEVPSSSEEWKFFSKTERAIAWHSPIQMKLRWVNEGEELKGFTDDKGKPRSALRSPQQYFKPGFSYMLRSSRLVPYIVPKGCIPTAGRSQVFPDLGKEIDVLTICASNLGSAVARFRGEMFARPKFQASMVQQLPFTDLSDDVKASAEHTMLTEIAAAKKFYSTDETTLDYSGCADLEIKREPTTNFRTLLGENNEIAVAKCYGLSRDEYDDLQLDLQQAVSLRKDYEATPEEELSKQAAFRYLSWLIGRVFGRWQDKVVQYVDTDIYAELPEQAPAFQRQQISSAIQLNGVADLESNTSLIKHVEEIATPDMIEKCLALLGEKDWVMFLSKPTQFFALHYDQYSQNRRYAPIYWPLQTPSGSYTLWVYYHRLNAQTPYICVNNFVQPKIEKTEQDLNNLRGKSARSIQEEKELVKLTDLSSELSDFRDELLRLAKFWKPNLNDGVQVTAAPLWKLFQHKAWQKKLNDTWEKLEQGDYDWTHLAMNYWPERVLRKCHQDRSLAIAHDFEDTFWHEVEVPVMRGKKPTGETKLEWQPKALTDDELDALIQAKIKEMRA
ncbi:BREX-1 system adenine-specific DNA-methyltransferase PglX [Sneathiella sp. P13V-1]|uniref:BREX-1 system adenine-specific DNA-methyltransferase PglX n=1 Tax=Sneathiella sp. P13V-1 TaxID=2697366 RepID=UPI00187BA2EE|nr:BREX-1 system adenine-specific DNA-methyltransferase PglX [Sneathiella sp. P13V-1]MBE7635962.1 BREX-1 system adenine-specific DNA-methyltransferase PglX [Sneathiella sp. P13V-1]